MSDPKQEPATPDSQVDSTSGEGDENVGEIEEGVERRGDTEPMPPSYDVDDDPENAVGEDEDDDWLSSDDEEEGL